MVDFFVLNTAFSQYVGWVMAFATLSVVGLFVKLWRCLQKQDIRSWKLAQSLKLFVDLVDDKTHELHPVNHGADIKDKIKELLGDDF